jgi:hypothetical protein
MVNFEWKIFSRDKAFDSIMGEAIASGFGLEDLTHTIERLSDSDEIAVVIKKKGWSPPPPGYKITSTSVNWKNEFTTDS